MREVALLGWNYLREQKVFLIVLSIYLVAGTGWLALSSEMPQLDDLSFLVKQQAGYAIVFGLFMTSGAVFNDRRSRRILMVLAKGIERGQYLAGIYLGSTVALSAYLFLSWVASAILLRRVGIGWSSVNGVIVAAGIATLLSAAIALFYSTMMHPMLAVGAAVITMSVPHAIAKLSLPVFDAILPAYAISGAVIGWSPNQPLATPPYMLLIAIAETGAFFLLAVLTFRGRDLALAVD
jgi:ABC-type transport system involved in multi-copper enzyme maturation permease subunit